MFDSGYTTPALMSAKVSCCYTLPEEFTLVKSLILLRESWYDHTPKGAHRWTPHCKRLWEKSKTT